MNKKKLTLLIALSIIILYLLSPYCALVVASAPTIDMVSSETAPVSSKEDLVGSSIMETTIQVASMVVDSEIMSHEETTSEVSSETKLEPITIEHVPNVRDFKSYTNYRLLNRKSSQWKKIQTIAYSDNNGLRKVDNYYCVAMGSYYTKTLGDLFRITTDTGNIFDVIITDFKADRHTNSTHQYTKRNKCIVEFYVDMNYLDRTVARSGTISSLESFSGKIVSIEKLGNYFTK